MIYAGQPDKQRKTLVDWDPLSFSNPQSNLNLSHSCSVYYLCHIVLTLLEVYKSSCHLEKTS